MKTITRRTALAASATLPLLPVSAFAAPAADTDLIRLGKELEGAWAREFELINSKTWGDTYEAAFNASSVIVHQIEEHQAHTLDGLRVKARAVMWCQLGADPNEPFCLGEHQTTDIRLTEAIILELAGVAS